MCIALRCSGRYSGPGGHNSNLKDVAAAAWQLGIRHMFQGVMAVGAPGVEPLQQNGNELEPLVDTLATLPLSAHTQRLLLHPMSHSSLHIRMEY